MIDYFYILTLAWNSTGRETCATRSGIAQIAEGTDQQEIFNLVNAEACKYFGAPEGLASTRFYYLAKNGA